MIVKHFTDMNSFAASAAVTISSALNDILASSGQASLFLAGGSTPVPVYKALARQRPRQQHDEMKPVGQASVWRHRRRLDKSYCRNGRRTLGAS